MSEAIQLLDAQAAATRQIVASTPEADFSKPTPGCPGWTVQQVVAHITTGAELFTGMARGTLSGEQWMTERLKRLEANSALAPAELKRRFDEVDRGFVDLMKSLSPEELQAKRSHPAFGEAPVAQFINMRIGETCIHGWDIQSAFDATAKATGPATPAIVPFLMQVFPSWFVPDAIAGVHKTYRFVLSGAINEERTLSIADGKASWIPADAPTDATIALDAADFMLFMSGRLKTDDLIASGRATASGDVEAAKALSSLFKAYGGR